MTVYTQTKTGSNFVAAGFHLEQAPQQTERKQYASAPQTDWLAGMGADDIAAIDKQKEEVELLATMVYGHLWTVLVQKAGNIDAYKEKGEAFKRSCLTNGEYIDREGNIKTQYRPLEEQHRLLLAAFEKMNLSPKYKAELKYKAIQRNKDRNKARLLANGENQAKSVNRGEYANAEQYTLAQLDEKIDQVSAAIQTYDADALEQPLTQTELEHYYSLKNREAELELRRCKLMPYVNPSYLAGVTGVTKAQAVAAAVESTRPL